MFVDVDVLALQLRVRQELGDTQGKRPAAGRRVGLLQQLYYGQALIVVQEEGDWLKVRLNDLTGYVMAQYVTRPGESPSPSPTPAR